MLMTLMRDTAVTCTSHMRTEVGRGGTNVQTVVLTKVAAASELSSYSFGLNQSVRSAGAITAYSGVDGSSPVEQIAVSNNPAVSTSITVPGVTTSGTGRWLHASVGLNIATTVTPAAGMTERVDQATGTGAGSVAVETADRSFIGTQSAQTFTGAGATLTVVIAVSLRSGMTTSGSISTMYRYSMGGTGDSPALILNTSNTVLERTISLAGGVLYAQRASQIVWSYPNMHGHVAITTDNAGTLTGGPYRYDPFGNPSTGTPGNSQGDYDYRWLGQHQRGTDNTANGIIQMGPRPYDPTAGRFLSIDPIEGGNENDYNYPTDPINMCDLDGRCSVWSPLECADDVVRDVVRDVNNAVA
jgi:RHS repeat-associated protein